MGLNRFDEAREAFTKAEALNPGCSYVQFLLGWGRYVDNDFRKAASSPANGCATRRAGCPRDVLSCPQQ